MKFESWENFLEAKDNALMCHRDATEVEEEI